MFRLTLLALLSLTGVARGYIDSHTYDPGTALVHLFQYTSEAAKAECRYLSLYGYGGIIVGPIVAHPNFEITETETGNTVSYPWWQAYQTSCYNIDSRFTNESAFIDMVETCNKYHMRVYVDVVLNHMTGNNAVVGAATGRGCIFNATGMAYYSVPYDSSHFHTNTTLDPDTNNKIEQRFNWYTNNYTTVADLNTSDSYVRNKQAEFLNKLLNYGVGGFKLSFAQNIDPEDLGVIRNQLGEVDYGFFDRSSDPLLMLEVHNTQSTPQSDYLQADGVNLGKQTEYKYSYELARRFRKEDNLTLSNLLGLGTIDMIASARALVFVDDFYSQRYGIPGDNIPDNYFPLTYQEAELYRMANAFTMAYDYGTVQVSASYNFSTSTERGPPTFGNFGEIWNPRYSSNGTCDNLQESNGVNYICEHHWRAIANMARFRKAVGDSTVNWSYFIGNKIAFSRGDRGFIAINNDDTDFVANVQTNMEPGTYCDIISGIKYDQLCTGGIYIEVLADGTTDLSISASSGNSMIAFTRESKIKY